jgi:glyoxylase-like metal-dependent hydrolase (beta-lactamase superfamily II)
VAAKVFSYSPERLGDDLFCIPLPLYDGTPVNAYLSCAPDGVWLIDGGLPTDECQATLRAGLAELGYGPKDLRGLLITHGHTDHVGAANAVLANGGEVLSHRIETVDGRRLQFDDTWLRRNGLPPNLVDDARWVEPMWPEPTRLLEDGERLQWGALELEVVWCPGHTRGLVCLYEPRRRLLFTTDHIMRRAPAPISLRDEDDGDPLRDYLASVARLKPLDVETVLPGHGRPFGDFGARVAEIETSIAGQLETIRQQLEPGPSVAFPLLENSEFRTRRRLAERYALSQLLARLRYLESDGTVVRRRTADLYRYALAV